MMPRGDTDGRSRGRWTLGEDLLAYRPEEGGSPFWQCFESVMSLCHSAVGRSSSRDSQRVHCRQARFSLTTRKHRHTQTLSLSLSLSHPRQPEGPGCWNAGESFWPTFVMRYAPGRPSQRTNHPPPPCMLLSVRVPIHPTEATKGIDAVSK